MKKPPVVPRRSDGWNLLQGRQDHSAGILVLEHVENQWLRLSKAYITTIAVTATKPKSFNLVILVLQNATKMALPPVGVMPPGPAQFLIAFSCLTSSFSVPPTSSSVLG